MISKAKKKPTDSAVAEKQKKIIQKKKEERVKEKLSGKNYSPIVAKGKSNKAALKKKVASPLPVNTAKKVSLGTSKVVKTKNVEGTRKAQIAFEDTSEPIVGSKNEKNIVKKSVKRKPEEVAVETSNKKTVIKSLNSVTLKKGKLETTSPPRTSLRKQNPKSQTQNIANDDGEPSVKTKKSKVDKNVTVSEVESKEHKKLESSIKEANKKTVGKKSAVKPTSVNQIEVDSVRLTQTESAVEKKTGKKGRKKSSSIANLKPISNIKTLRKRPSPTLLKAKALKRQKEAAKYPERGVCYFTHIPHGFYEKQLKAYCSQFGKVTGVYHPLSRDGNSRGYAFVEFKNKEVAEVVADTMNNYLMFNRLIKCKYIPPEEQRPWVFKHKKNNFKIAEEKRKRAMKHRNKTLSKEEEEKWQKRKMDRIDSLHKKLAALEVDYEFQVNDGTHEKKEVTSP